MKTLAVLLSETTEKFKAAGLDSPETDARLLVQNAMNMRREDLFLNQNRIASEIEEKTLSEGIDRRLNREPVSRILGTRGFWKSDFKINPETLDPRPDSEVLIENVLKYFLPQEQSTPLMAGVRPRRVCGVYNNDVTFKADGCCLFPASGGKGQTPAFAGVDEEPLDILDLGTGSGCLLLSLLQEMPQARGMGVDISVGAVKTAEENAKALGLSGRAAFVTADWNHLEKGLRFDIIISNPPYISDEEMTGLAPEVALYDPPRALLGGKDGLDCYRSIICLLPQVLKEKGYVFFEIGRTQAKAVKDLLEQGGFIVLEVVPDFGQNDRCVVARRAG